MAGDDPDGDGVPNLEELRLGTNPGSILPPDGVLTVLVYNQNDPPWPPPATVITISPTVGTITNWMYTAYLTPGTYTAEVSAPKFSSGQSTAEVSFESASTEVFFLVPDPGSVSGKFISAHDMSPIRGASVQLEVTSGIYEGKTYDAVTGTDGGFSLADLPTTINYQVIASKTFCRDCGALFTLNPGEAKDLGTISLRLIDEDDDGLPEEFEQAIVDFNPEDGIDDITDVRADDDFDGDGKTNREEYLAGTDATSPSSCFTVTVAVCTTPETFSITWATVPGMLYRVYYSDTLGTWFVGASDIPASGTGMNSWTDNEASGTIPPAGEASLRFYRIEAY